MKTNKTEKKGLNYDGFESLQSEMKVLIKGGVTASQPAVCEAGGAINILCDNAGKKEVGPIND